jgi:aminoglycoside phosphotransferase (APT) family kinase protein
MIEAHACAALRAAGFAVEPAEISIAEREGCWTVSLPGDRLAWFPRDDGGRERLARERHVLKLLAERCTFRAPRLLYACAEFDVRAIVPGKDDAWALYHRIGRDPALARRHGQALGSVLVEQHTRIAHADVAGWVRADVHWPEPSDWVRARLPDVVGDRALIRRIEAMLRRYEAVPVAADDRVLVHTDFGLHNVATDPQTDDFQGIFDYGEAAWADRHHDFRYLVLDIEREELLAAALTVYEQATGRRLDRDRILLYNAACAASFLAFRRGVPAEAISCGRTLEQDLGWIRAALAKVEGASIS